MPTPGPIAKAISAALVEREWTITDLAVKAGVSRPNLSRYLAGRRAMNSDTLEAVLGALGKLNPVVKEIRAPKPPRPRKP